MIEGFNIKTIADIELTGKRILIRVDFNVIDLKHPEKLEDTLRIDATLPTLFHLLDRNNSLILCAHVSETDGPDPNRSLKPVVGYLEQKIKEKYPDKTVQFFENYIDAPDQKMIQELPLGSVSLLENLRFHEGEKNCDTHFAEILSQLADVFVQDAFGVCHRDATSTITLPQTMRTQGKPILAGLLLQKEIETLHTLTNNPQRPFTAVIGGSKISTKISVIDTFLKTADHILLGGGVANNLIKAQGHSIGKSIHEDDQMKVSEDLLKYPEAQTKLHIPTDARIGDLNNLDFNQGTRMIDDIPDDTYILDLGPQTIQTYKEILQQSKTILWAGPMGYFEHMYYAAGTHAVFEAMAHNEGALTIMGGGDTLGATHGNPLRDKISHISTGGGAMLEFIELGTLPGINVLK